MELSKESLNTLNLICATLSYNGERIGIMEKMLKKFLLEQPKDTIDVKKETRTISDSQGRDFGFEPEKMFYQSDSLLSIAVTADDVLEYVVKRYFVYDDIFKKHYGYSIQYVPLIGWAMACAMGENSEYTKFIPDIYRYKSDEEYHDMGFVELPDEKYVENWGKTMRFSLKSLIEQCPPGITQDFYDNIESLVKTCSFDLDELKNNPDLRFKQKPVMRISKEEVVILIPIYLNRNLHQIIELMLRECKEYRDVKGTAFEEMSLDLLEKSPNSKLVRNINYKGFELDGLLNLNNSSWFIECSSHPPSIKALLGDEVSVKSDLEKTVEKCERQAIRAIESSTEPDIAKFSPKAKMGSIIILEGTYPSLNQNANNLIDISPKVRKDLPRYVINYFELQEILRQPEAFLFEEFLLWRTQDGIPLVCLDERDYWAWFVQMKSNPDMENAFESNKEKHNIVTYISARFNEKRHLEKLN